MQSETSGSSREGGVVGNDGCNGGGGVVMTPNLAVTFPVGTTQEQQVDSRTAASAGHPPSIESIDTVNGGGDNSREASSYVWRVLVRSRLYSFLPILFFVYNGPFIIAIELKANGYLSGLSCLYQSIHLPYKLSIRHPCLAGRTDNISYPLILFQE